MTTSFIPLFAADTSRSDLDAFEREGWSIEERSGSGDRAFHRSKEYASEDEFHDDVMHIIDLLEGMERLDEGVFNLGLVAPFEKIARGGVRVIVPDPFVTLAADKEMVTYVSVYGAAKGT